jgi:pimeloyl-ACP methyl ester carboxylesterase
MLRALLLRGIFAGLCAGILASGFAAVVGEPQVGQAISFEDQQARTAGVALMPAIVSRDVQSSAGLLTGAVVYGLSLGGLFSLAFAALYGRVGRASPARTTMWLVAGVFVVVFLVPFLKYPANPPSVGKPETIGTRTELYLLMLASSILAAIIAVRLGRWLVGRWGSTTAALVAIASFIVLVVPAGLVLPGVNEVPGAFPAVTLWNFRIASLGTQLVMWTTMGLIFAAASQRLMTRQTAQARSSRSAPGVGATPQLRKPPRHLHALRSHQMPRGAHQELDQMCEILDDKSVSVCDSAIDRYRLAMGDLLGTAVSFTHVDYQPTLIECRDQSRLPEFQDLVRQLIHEP